MGVRVAIYTRVSTNGQETANQLRELEAVAERHSWEVVARFSDQGISGTKGREQRPGLRGLHEAITRRQVDIVAAWSVDRIGRSLGSLVAFMEECKAKGINLYLHQQQIDTTTPSGKALLQMCGVFAEFEREMIVERVNAGLARAVASGVKLGRQPIEQTDPKKVKAIEAALIESAGVNVKKVGRTLGVGTGTVQRIRAKLIEEGKLVAMERVSVPKPKAITKEEARRLWKEGRAKEMNTTEIMDTLRSRGWTGGRP